MQLLLSALPLEDLLPPLVDGIVVTVRITALASVLGIAVAVLAGIGRLSASRPVRLLVGAYVEFFRGTAILIQLFWLFYALPELGVRLSADQAGVLALGLNIGAYGSEVVRGAILAVPREQLEAATVLSFGPVQRLRRVVLPQAVPRMVPPFNNLLIELLKATALVSLITLSDLTFEAQKLRVGTGETVQIFAAVLVLYFMLALTITACMRALERKVAIPGLEHSRP